jgi:CheY-like chemotaxis protein
MAGRVLIVEDDALVRMMTVGMVEECGLSVVEASSADEALHRLDEIADEIAVVITDVRMPGELDGVDLAKFVSAAWPNIRVMVTSGYSGGRVSGLPKTVTFLPKPWKPLDVINFVLKAAPPET